MALRNFFDDKKSDKKKAIPIINDKSPFNMSNLKPKFGFGGELGGTTSNNEVNPLTNELFGYVPDKSGNWGSIDPELAQEQKDYWKLITTPQFNPDLSSQTPKEPVISTTNNPYETAPIAESPTTENPKQSKRNRLQLDRPVTPNKADFLDTERISKSKEEAKHIAKANAMIAVMTALMDATNINKESYQNMSPFVAQQSAYIPQFMQQLQQEERLGLDRYNQAMQAFNNANMSLSNQEKISEYNRDNALADRDEARIYQERLLKENRTYQEGQKRNDSLIRLGETMMRNGNKLEDVNNYFKEAGLPPISSLPERAEPKINGKTSSEVEKRLKTPTAIAGLKIVMRRINSDPNRTAGNEITNSDLLILNSLKNDEAIEAYATTQFDLHMRILKSESTNNANSGNIEGLKKNRDDFRDLFYDLGWDKNMIEKELMRLFPTLYNQEVNPIASTPANASQAPSINPFDSLSYSNAQLDKTIREQDYPIAQQVSDVPPQNSNVVQSNLQPARAIPYKINVQKELQKELQDINDIGMVSSNAQQMVSNSAQQMVSNSAVPRNEIALYSAKDEIDKIDKNIKDFENMVSGYGISEDFKKQLETMIISLKERKELLRQTILIQEILKRDDFYDLGWDKNMIEKELMRLFPTLYNQEVKPIASTPANASQAPSINPFDSLSYSNAQLDGFK